MSLRSLVATLIVLAPSALPAQGRRPPASEIARAVDSLATAIDRARLAPGFGVAVVMDGRTILARSYGQADATRGIAADDRTLWYLASTSKSFTGFAAALLAEEGVLSFDAPITRLLPNARWHADARPESLTLARFLSHTQHLRAGAVVMNAAFTGAVPESRWPQLLAYSGSTGSTDLLYNNLGYNVAAMAIAVVHPQGWRHFLDARVFAPAGMTETYHRVTGLDARRFAVPHSLRADGRFDALPFVKNDVTMNSAGGHLATLHDLARWTMVQMDSGMLDGRRVFPAAVVARSHALLAPHTRAESRQFAYFARDGWGAGWDIGWYDGVRMVSRFGSYASTRSHLSFLPGRRIGVVAMTNGRTAWTATDVVAAFAYDLEAGRPDARDRAAQRLRELVQQRDASLPRIAVDDSVRRARQSQALQRPLAAFAGRYEHPGYGVIDFTVVEGRLHYRWGALSGVAEILDAGAHTMRIEIGTTGTPARFTFGASGPASAVTIQDFTLTRQGAGALRLPSDSLEVARRYARWFMGGHVDSLIAGVPPAALQSLGGREGILQAKATVDERAGREAQLIEERFVWRNGKRQYWRTMAMTAMEEHFLLRVVIEHDGSFGGFGLGPVSGAPPVDSGAPPIRRP